MHFLKQSNTQIICTSFSSGDHNILNKKLTKMFIIGPISMSYNFVLIKRNIIGLAFTDKQNQKVFKD